MPYFVRAGLRVVLGVFLYKGKGVSARPVLLDHTLTTDDTRTDEPSWSEAEKEMAIASYHQHPEHTIAIYVGNEDLVPFGPYTADDLIGHMNGTYGRTDGRHACDWTGLDWTGWIFCRCGGGRCFVSPSRLVRPTKRNATTTDIRAGGVKAPVGTVQRLTEWVMDDPSVDRLADACDVIGGWVDRLID